MVRVGLGVSSGMNKVGVDHEGIIYTGLIQVVRRD